MSVHKADPQGPMAVSDVKEGSSAAENQIQVGDRILAVMGTETQSMTAEQCAGLLLGDPDTQVPVTVWSAEQGQRQVWLQRRRDTTSYTPVYDFHRKKRPVPKPGEFGATLSHSNASQVPEPRDTRHPPECEALWQAQLRCLQEGVLDEAAAATQLEGLRYSCSDAHLLPPTISQSLNATRAVVRRNRELENLNERLEVELQLARQIVADMDKEDAGRRRGAGAGAGGGAGGGKGEQGAARGGSPEEKREWGGLKEEVAKERPTLPMVDSAGNELAVDEAMSFMHEKTDALLKYEGERPVEVGERALIDMMREMALMRSEVDGARSRKSNVGEEGAEEREELLLRLQAEVEQHRYLRELADERGTEVLRLHAKLEEANTLTMDLKHRYDAVLHESSAMRDVVGGEKGVNSSKDVTIANLQQQVEQMQLLALHQSAEAEQSVRKMGELQSLIGNQEAEILRLNAAVKALEDKHQKQIRLMDEAAERWRMKRDAAQEEVEECKTQLARRDEVIAKHTKLIQEYQSVLDVVKSVGGASTAFKPVKPQT